MARKEDAGLIEKNVEKVVLGAAAVILIVAGIHWGLSSPRRVKLETDALGIGMPPKGYSPEEVDQALKTASERLETMLNRKGADVKHLPDYVTRLAGIYKNPYDDQKVHPSVPFGPGHVPPERIDPGKTLEPPKLADLLPLPKPEEPLVKVCREVQVVLMPDGGGEYREGEYKKAEYKEVDAAHGVVVFNHGKVLKKWQEALKGTYVSAQVVFVAVETQRRYQMPDGSWSRPEPVPMVVMPDAPTLPTVPTPDGKNLLEIQQMVNELAWISNQKYIIEPPYYDIIWPDRRTGTWQTRNNKPRTHVSDLLEQEAEKPATPDLMMKERDSTERLAAERRAAAAAAERRRAAAAAIERRRASTGLERGGLPGGGLPGERRPGGGLPGGGLDREGVERRPIERRPVPAGPVRADRIPTEIDAPMLVLIPTLQEQLDNPAGIIEAWFHDTSLTEGMTYSYSVRLVLINPLLGRFKDVADKDDAKVQTLKTPWSDWSKSAKVERPAEFFLVGSAPQMGTVEVEVFTQRWGQRVNHRFRVGPGEPIGGDVNKDMLQLGDDKPTSTVVSFRTGDIAVSFDFEKKQRVPGTDFFRTTTTELLYLDADGKLRTRTRFADESSSRYKELLNEVRQAAGTTADVR